MPEAVIVEAVRTPIGRHGGILKTVRPDDFGALVLAEVVKRAKIDPVSGGRSLYGLRQSGGRRQPECGPHGHPAGRLSRFRRRRDLQPPLRFRVDGGQCRGPGHQGRGRRRLYRGRGGKHDPGPLCHAQDGSGVRLRKCDRLGHDDRVAVSQPQDEGKVRPRFHGGDRRKYLRTHPDHFPGRAGPLLPRKPPPGRGRDRIRKICGGNRSRARSAAEGGSDPGKPR